MKTPTQQQPSANKSNDHLKTILKKSDEKIRAIFDRHERRRDDLEQEQADCTQ